MTNTTNDHSVCTRLIRFSADLGAYRNTQITNDGTGTFEIHVLSKTSRQQVLLNSVILVRKLFLNPGTGLQWLRTLFLSVWNSLTDELRDPACGSDSFKQFLRQSCLVFSNVTSALQVFLNVMRYINPRFTYLLTYLLLDFQFPKTLQ